MRRSNDGSTSSITLMTTALRVPNWLLSLLNGRVFFLRECLSHEFGGIVDIRIIGSRYPKPNLLSTGNLLSACARIDSIMRPRDAEIKGAM